MTSRDEPCSWWGGKRLQRDRGWGLAMHNLGERIGEVFSQIESHNITLITECGWPALILFCLPAWLEFFRKNKLG